MANLTTYICTADDMVLDKSNHLSIEDNAVPIKFFEDTSLIRPRLKLSANISQNFNYAYIDEFDRYYFLADRTFCNGYYYVTLRIDPRMSFKDEIADLNVIAKRCSSRYNLYQFDEKVPKLAKDMIQTQPFPYGFGVGNYILAVCGG